MAVALLLRDLVGYSHFLPCLCGSPSAQTVSGVLLSLPPLSLSHPTFQQPPYPMKSHASLGLFSVRDSNQRTEERLACATEPSSLEGRCQFVFEMCLKHRQ